MALRDARHQGSFPEAQHFRHSKDDYYSFSKIVLWSLGSCVININNENNGKNIKYYGHDKTFINDINDILNGVKKCQVEDGLF